MVIFTTTLVGIEQLILFEIDGTFFSHPISLWGFLLTLVGLQSVGFSPLTFNGPLWQTGILLIMYVLYYLTSKCRYRNVAYVGCILVGAVIICHGYGPIAFFVPEVGRGLVSFFVGVLLCKYQHKFKYLKVTSCVFVIMSTLLMTHYGEMIIGNINLFFALGFFPACIICITTINGLNQFFSNRFLTYLGKISFDIYAYHFPILALSVIIYKLQVFLSFKFYFPEFFIGYVVVSIFVGALSNKFIDKRLEKRFKLVWNELTLD